MLLATPGLYRLYKDISGKPEPNGHLIECHPISLTSGERRISVEFTFLTTAEAPPEQSKNYSKGSRQVYVVAELTNLTEKPVGLESLNVKLVRGKVTLVNEPVWAYMNEPLILEPNGKTKLQTVTCWAETICDWLVANELEPDSAVRWVAPTQTKTWLVVI